MPLHICLTCIKHTHTHRYTKTQGSSCFFDAKHPVFPRYPTNPQKEKHPHSVLCRIAEVIPLRCVRFILCLGGFGGVFHPWKSRDPDQAIRGWVWAGWFILRDSRSYQFSQSVWLTWTCWVQPLYLKEIYDLPWDLTSPQAGCNRGKWRFCSGFPSKHVIITITSGFGGMKRCPPPKTIGWNPTLGALGGCVFLFWKTRAFFGSKLSVLGGIILKEMYQTKS